MAERPCLALPATFLPSRPGTSGALAVRRDPGAHGHPPPGVLPGPVRVMADHGLGRGSGASPPVTFPDRPSETEAERDDRNLAELLQELRVAGIGVQVIFGFLLSLPFYMRFTTLGQAQRVLYLVAVMLAAVSTALLLGPVAYHRLIFRRRLKESLVRAANAMAICGLATVGLTICTVVLLVVSAVVKGLPALLMGVFVVCVFAGLWFVLPLSRRWAGALPEPAEPKPAAAQAQAQLNPDTRASAQPNPSTAGKGAGSPSRDSG